MDHVAGPLQMLLAEKEGRIWFDIICLKLYKYERTTWWCLSILEFVMEPALQSVMLEKNIFKNHGLPEFGSRPPLGGGLGENSGRP
jgi:hypothetical protein